MTGDCYVKQTHLLVYAIAGHRDIYVLKLFFLFFEKGIYILLNVFVSFFIRVNKIKEIKLMSLKNRDKFDLITLYQICTFFVSHNRHAWKVS